MSDNVHTRLRSTTLAALRQHAAERRSDHRIGRGLDEGGLAASGRCLLFGPFKLDVLGERLWRDGQLVALRPKSFAVLCQLVQHSQQLVKKDELILRVWGEVAVGDAVLNTSLKEIRQALGDSARNPRFVQTAHGRGYRFIAPVSSGDSSTRAPDADGSALSSSGRSPSSIGRHTELSHFERALANANAGRRQTLFVVGEPGIGKKTLVDEFAARAAGSGEPLFARGRCLDQQCAAEPYLPILEALGRLCQSDQGGVLREALEQAAPSWLEQFAWLSGAKAARERRPAHLVTPRMLRELSDALDLMTQQHALVLCVEELQHADAATLDLVHYLSQRVDRAALMLVCTYCPLDGRAVNRQRIRNIERDLDLRGAGHSFFLPCLDTTQVSEYLARRFTGHAFPAELATLVSSRTHGKPSFLVKLLDSWVERGWLAARSGQWTVEIDLGILKHDLPESIVKSVEGETDALSRLQRSILEAASVIGPEFSAAAIAVALGEDLADVEEECLQMARARRFLRLTGRFEPWGGSGLPCLAFLSPLQFEAIGARMGVVRRLQLAEHLAKTPYPASAFG